MPELQHDLLAALTGTPWHGWALTPVAGDASARFFWRAESGQGQSVIVLDDRGSNPPTIARMAMITQHLRANDIPAATIFARLEEDRFAVLEDLGRIDLAQACADDPQIELGAYALASDLLLRLRQVRISGLTAITQEMAGQMVEITASHYAAQPDLSDHLAEEVQKCYASLGLVADTLALRDFHAQNLMWRPTCASGDMLVPIDLQDAVLAPEGYDLASLLTDARRDISQDLRKQIIRRYASARGFDLSVFETHVRFLSIQRNLRILGVFARLARVAGKRHYVSLIPRVWGYLMADLDDLAFADLRRVVLELPPPSPPHLETLNAA